MTNPPRPAAAARSVRLVGFGGHGREVLDCLRRAGADRADQALSVEVVHDRERPDPVLLSRHRVTWEPGLPPDGVTAYLGIGSGRVRADLAPRTTAGLAVIDPAAAVGPTVTIGAGSIIFAGATVTVDITLGRHVHIGRGAAIGHDCEVGDFVTVLPLASVSGNVRIGAGTTIGTGALIRQGVTIGANAFVGMGAVVLDDVPDDTTVVGVPATPLRRNDDSTHEGRQRRPR